MAVSPHPTQPSTREYIGSEAIARDYDDYFADNALFDYDSALLARWLPQPGRLVDLGCGSGRHVVQFARARCDVTGVDLSHPMLQITAGKLSDAGLSATLVEADITDLASRFAPGYFDYALCMFSTFGLIAGRDNRARALRNWHRCLAPGGLLAMHVHNRWHHLWSPEGIGFLMVSAVQALARRREWGDKHIAHYRGIRNMYIHVFSRRELIDALRGAAFEVVELVELNENRDGPLRPGRTAHLRANGYLVLARRMPLESRTSQPASA
jgi:SAM-dependent methyltransferase